MTLGQGQGMTLTLNTHVVSFTYLGHCIYQLATVSAKKRRIWLFPYKILCEQIWPWPKIGRRYPSVIIWTNYDLLEFQMLNTRFHDNRLTGSREEDFLKVFYLIRTWRPSWSSDLDPANKLSFPHPMGAPHKKMTSIGLVVSEEKMFENVDRRQTTDYRRQMATIEVSHIISSPVSLRLRWANKARLFNTLL